MDRKQNKVAAIMGLCILLCMFLGGCGGSVGTEETSSSGED